MLLCFPFVVAVALAVDAPELDTFRPSPLAALGATDALESAPAGTVETGVWFQSDQQSWVRDDGVPVSNRLVLTPAAAVHLGFGVAFEAALPVVLADIGYDPDANQPWEGAALGRPYARFRLGHSFGDLRLGVGLRADLPRTELQASLGGGALINPEATAVWARGPLLVAVSGAARSGWVGARGGLSLSANGGSVFVESETAGDFGAIGTELRGGARANFGPVGVEAGVGAGLVTFEGQPTTRMWAALTFDRRAKTAPAPEVITVVPTPVPVPAEVQEVDLTLPIQLPGLFLTGGVRLAEDGSERISAVSEYLESRPNLRVRIEAHMHAVAGVDDFTVSQVRADRIRQALIERGIAAERIESIGFGSGVYNEDIIEIVQAD